MAEPSVPDLPRVPRNDRFDVLAPRVPLADLGAVHVLAAGGAGMSAIVRLLLDAGVDVRGSDQKDSPLIGRLRERGATIWVGHDPAHLAGADTIVVSSAVRESNPELAEARRTGLRVLHRSQALASAMGEQTRVAVAGANGKTTTSSMLTVALLEAGQRPSFALGGELSTEGVNAALGAGDAFVAEADESDGSFLAYRPQVAVVTNVQPDHLDFYGDLATVEAADREFAGSVTSDGGPREGLLIACADDPGSARLADRVRAAGGRVTTYGFSEGADVRLGDPVLAGTEASASLHDGSGPERLLSIRVPGRHNLLNAAAAWTAAVHGLGVAADEVLTGLTGYGGTRRRFETKGVARGVTVVDDYAHNPGKVEAVVRTAREIAGERRLIVVFQPHLYSRTRDFCREFAAGLAPADEVVLLDVYGAREDPEPGVTSDLIATPLAEAGTSVSVLGKDAAVARVLECAGTGDLVLTVGAGDVTELAPRIVTGLAGGDR